MPPSATIKDFDHDAPSLAVDPYLQLTRIFVYFLQNLFREAPEGMGLKWRPEQEDSELIVTDEKPRLDAVEKKPHIVCVLGASAWGGLGFDQMQRRDMMIGSSRTHTDLVSGTVSYNCQAREGLHARRLAWYASYFTNVYRRIIMRYGKLHQIGVNHQISAESPPSAFTGPTAEGEIVSVVVTVPFYWQSQWRITDPSEVFRGVRFTLDVGQPQRRYSAGEVATVRKASIYGRPVNTIPLEPKPSRLQQIVEDHKYAGEEE
jgi:hypothetical protein